MYSYVFHIQSIVATVDKYELSGIHGLKHIDMQWSSHVSGTRSVGLERVSADFKPGADHDPAMAAKFNCQKAPQALWELQSHVLAGGLSPSIVSLIPGDPEDPDKRIFLKMPCLQETL